LPGNKLALTLTSLKDSLLVNTNLPSHPCQVSKSFVPLKSLATTLNFSGQVQWLDTLIHILFMGKVYHDTTQLDAIW